MPDRMPERMSEYMLEKMSDRMSESTPNIYFQMVCQKLCRNNWQGRDHWKKAILLDLLKDEPWAIPKQHNLQGPDQRPVKREA